ncbi:SDR family NAD(P)-dependent oxidoreductase [Mobilicoccus sp.]|uniref:SDR family NAD(P)-dependent oxidoreductase n=2 Tax=Mobilicoccus sp. TaxID=2034349 RepID=UPI0028A9420B|nr:SDR family NAD(P)-dependent oxidoreductase [Mobilicoccus sp.]
MANTRQAPLGSGFTAASTADDVVAGVDLDGRTALVTGGYSGLGLETTRALVKVGARVLVPARRPDVAIAAAGVMAAPERRVGPGWESQFATNHLGHYVLVNLLFPLLASADGARVVSYSSAGHFLSDIRWDDMQFEHGYDKWQAYGQSKTADVLFAVHLDAIAKDRGVRAFAVHPGGIITDLQRHMTAEEQIAWGWIDAEGNVVGPGFKTPSQGAATGLWAATSPLLENRGGVYCEDCDIAPLARPGASGKDGGVRDYAVDPQNAERLWRASAQMTGVDLIGTSAT